MLLNGHILIINGATAGTAGWLFGRDPVPTPVIYQLNERLGSRFVTLNATTIPQMYHSSVNLVRNGRILVGGGNPNMGYVFQKVLFPTKLQLEAFYPPYLDTKFSTLRQKIMSLTSHTSLIYSQKLVLQFVVTGTLARNMFSVTMVVPSLSIHSFSQNQRLIQIEPPKNLIAQTKSTYQIEVTTPRLGLLAPPGFYLLFVVHQDIPSEGFGWS